MFPSRNVKGESVGFGGRVLGDEKPKYLNSPETPVLSKSRRLHGRRGAGPAWFYQCVGDSGHRLNRRPHAKIVSLYRRGGFQL